jgi:hypothetical protein
MKKEIDNILSTYLNILKNKNVISEIMVTPSQSSYSNIKFAKRTQNDQINKALLDDLDAAAKMAGVDITVDFAKTGHGKNTKSGNVSRHWMNSAVDIDFIDGKVVSPANRSIVDKFVNALVSMGYVKNSESGNPKAVLTFGFPAHDNHVHVSNTNDVASSQVTDYTPTSSDDDTSSIDSEKSTKSGSTAGYEVYREDPLMAALGSEFYSQLKNESIIREQVSSKEVGKNCFSKYGQINCPSDSNKKVYSPVTGKIKKRKYDPSCKNSISIEFKVNETSYYIEYCGIDNPQVKEGKSINKGDLIGKTDSDFTVSIYDISGDREFFDSKFVDTKRKSMSYDDINKVHREDPIAALAGQMFAKPFNILGDKYDKDGKRIEKRWASPTDPVQPEPWFQKMSPTYPKKIREDIEKIKKML